MNILAASAELENIDVANAGIVAVLGYGVVFLGLIALMVVVILLGKAFVAAANRKKVEAPAVEAEPYSPAPAQDSLADAPVAPGSAGGVKLHDVEPKTAAMLMAIVADKMGKPLNELRFISIKEVK